MPPTPTSANPRPVPRPAPSKPFREAVQSAALIGSSHLARPWVFRLRGSDTLELCADRRRALPAVDSNARESIIGCGAALFQLSVALQAAGHAVGVELVPDPTDRDLLARVRLDAPHLTTPGDRALIAAIEHGGTAVADEDRPVAPHVLSLLLGAARVEGAWLGFVDAPELREALAGLIAEAKYPGPPVPRVADRDDAPAARAHAWVERAPTVAVLTTRGDAVTDWLVAGQALARVLLTAHAAGLSASYLIRPIELPESRSRVADLVRAAADPGVPGRRGGMPIDATPQIVLRLGYARAAVVG
jgi:hypothetical protein